MNTRIDCVVLAKNLVVYCRCRLFVKYILQRTKSEFDSDQFYTVLNSLARTEEYDNLDTTYLLWCPHQDLNLELLLRTELFYPLNYRGDLMLRMLQRTTM
jgi:hypothetical protein